MLLGVFVSSGFLVGGGFSYLIFTGVDSIIGIVLYSGN